MLRLAVLLATSPTSLDCLDAHCKRFDLAVQMRALPMRESDQGGLNRAETGAYRAIKSRREGCSNARPIGIFAAAGSSRAVEGCASWRHCGGSGA